MLLIKGKIPIRIYPFFWLLAFAIGWINSFEDMPTMNAKIIGTFIWVAIIVVSVLVHEFGHALSALAFGQKAQIDLVGMGGLTHRLGKKLKLWQEFIVVINGPIFGLLLALLAYQVRLWMGKPTTTMWMYTIDIILYVNVFWTLINLLPIQPLDGGRLFSIILEGLFGVKGIKIALFFSIVLSALLGLYFFLIHAILAGALFLILAFESYRTWQSSLPITETDQDLTMQDMLKEAENAIKEGNQEAALEKLRLIRENSKSGVIYLNATQHLATILSSQGKFKEAYQILSPLYKKLTPEGLQLLHQLAYLSGDLNTAITLGNQSYQNNPGYNTALINAICHALLGQAKPAVGWLNCAIRDGMPNLRAILSKTEFDKIRQNPIFQELQNNLN